MIRNIYNIFYFLVMLPSIFFGFIKLISELIWPEEKNISKFIVWNEPNPSNEYLIDN